MSKSLPTDPPPDDSSPSGAHVSASALDFLLIELVPVAQRVTERVHAREQALIDEYRRSKLLRASAAERPRSAAAAAPADSSEDADTDGDAESDAADAADAAASEKRASVLTTATTATMRTATATATATASSPRQSQPEPAITSLGFPALGPTTKDSLFRRLESQGHRVGQGLVERYAPRPLTPVFRTHRDTKPVSRCTDRGRRRLSTPSSSCAKTSGPARFANPSTTSRRITAASSC